MRRLRDGFGGGNVGRTQDSGRVLVTRYNYYHCVMMDAACMAWRQGAWRGWPLGHEPFQRSDPPTLPPPTPQVPLNPRRWIYSSVMGTRRNVPDLTCGPVTVACPCYSPPPHSSHSQRPIMPIWPRCHPVRASWRDTPRTLKSLHGKEAPCVR